MELAQKAKRVVVMTSHTTKSGAPKILKFCRLPLTAPSCVTTIITERAVLDVTRSGLHRRELAEEWTLDDVRELIEADMRVPAGELPRF